MAHYIQRNQVELLADEPTSSAAVFYLPHHAARKEKRGQVKWRIVFDGSSHGPASPSLNDSLEMGPNLLPEILATLLRFRLNRYAIIGDGSQAFLQLSLHPDDRDSTRFLWYRTENDADGKLVTSTEVATYRFKRLPFGLTSSPFLLSATIRDIAETLADDFPTVAPLIHQNLFMDDFASGASSESAVIAIYRELTSLMLTIKLPMAKWATNSFQLRDVWSADNTATTMETRVLGVDWNTHTDEFRMDPADVLCTPDAVATKRLVLRTISRFYDPLGLFTPLSIRGKILFQETWCLGTSWDEILPTDVATRWAAWLEDLRLLDSIRVPRWVHTLDLSQDVTIHVFADASEKAYGAALYLHVGRGPNSNVTLVCSKNRLVPLKKVTLPRLELLAALTGARLLDYFCRETGLTRTNAVMWSDSTVCLNWIRSNPSRWKTFVQNRVTEIAQLTTPTQWRHCPGSNNPADLLTRGLSTTQLRDSTTWWHGPAWLPNADSWPSTPAPVTKTGSFPEERKSSHQVLAIETPTPLLDPSRYSSYTKLIRTTAWIQRFSSNCRSRNRASGELTAEELDSARSYWIQNVQRTRFAQEYHDRSSNRPLSRTSKLARYMPFLQDGLLRLGGRLHFASVPSAERHPIILDGDHHFTRLLIEHTHRRLLHLGVRITLAELRSEFFILNARRIVKSALGKCLLCRIARGRTGAEIEAPLPRDRVTPSHAFAATGVDFAGPLYVRRGSEVSKAYIVLFTCASTRALHLELSSTMATDCFLMAFHRFIGRRCIPTTMYSVNAKAFHASNDELKSLWPAITDPRVSQTLASHGIAWKFIAAKAAWWGGFWERMVGSTKQCLRKVLGKAQLTEEELTTVLVGIEAALNSRPLTFDYAENDPEGPLTPAHFLVGQRLTALPTLKETTKQEELTKTFRHKQKLMDDFWRRWSKEYLLELRQYHEVRQPDKIVPVKVGDVVLLKEEIRPRHVWQHARVTEVRTGRDGRARTAILTTKDRHIISRPIQMIVPLEIYHRGEDVAPQQPTTNGD